jgi:subtilisin family serine protease
MIKGRLIALAACNLAGLLLSLAVFAADTPRNGGVFAGEALQGDRAASTLKRFVVEFPDPPLALYDGRELSAADRGGPRSLPATTLQISGEPRLNPRSPAALVYLEYIAERHEEFRLEAALLLGRPITPIFQYRTATNGMALDLTEAEAAALAASPLLKSIKPDTRHRLQTDAGPEWIGAAAIWEGVSGFPQARGEGVIVGVIDSGINWEHPSFADPAPDGYVYSNPLGQQLGLCDDPEVECNGKLIGVYDFVEDDPATEDVVEENTKGRDNDGHGSHVASIAVGNRANVLLNSTANATLSGVAPRANLVTYRVCYIGEPVGLDSGGCAGSAILSAIDQAVDDGVDVINYSIGSGPSDPWANGSIARAYLAARGAGVFVATSAGNEGPNPGTVGSPANAPWIIAVGNATHNRVFGTLVQNLTGGATTPPADLAGASLTGGSGQRLIVHAKDYGFPLCGSGPEELGSTCASNTGASNPWQGQTPFNGEIVVCDRGQYGRVEKGKNVLLAGAGGYILANTEEFGESVTADTHCLPSSHIGREDGDSLRAWLDSGTGHGGSISAFTLSEKDSFGDQLSETSSRGPALAPVENTLKPNLIAPGTQILAAIESGQEFNTKSGTSMASPHIAGAAALLKSVHSGWNVSQIASAIETTATAGLATVGGTVAATPHQRGAGRPQLADAANAGLYLNVTTTQFMTANPATGGDPGALNLAGLVNAGCEGTCSFTRAVTDQMGGGNWSATAVDFPAGVGVTVNPASFNLANGASRALNIGLTLAGSGKVGEWVDGRVRLSSAGAPDQYLTVSVFYSGGDLPEEWHITDDRSGGWVMFNLSGLAAMPDATFRSGGLQPVARTVQVLPEDSSNEDPYNGGPGVFTKWHNMPQGGLWLYAETLASTAEDLDLFVGRDDNGNGLAEETEELCTSTAPNDLERCDLFDLPPGNYWIVVQNWTGSEPGGDEATLRSAAIGPSAGSNLAVSGPGIVAGGANFSLRLSWDNVGAVPGQEWLGAVGIGTSRDHPNNIGVIPVRFTRSGISQPATFPLFDGMDHRLAVAAGTTHDRLFIDVPPGSTALTVSASALASTHNNNLSLELRRLGFAAALADPPFAVAPAGAPVVASDAGGGGAGPELTVSGAALQAGRWYAVLHNGNAQPSNVEIRAEVAAAGATVPIHRGLWAPSSRPGSGHGYEYNWGESDRALIWYTYDEAGQPAWYIAGSPPAAYDIWTSPLYRVSNDGMEQQLARVGDVSITNLAENDALFSFTLFGLSGTERMQPLSPLTCPQVNGAPASYTGLWYRGVAGLGGASVVVNSSTQAQIHYLFDAAGEPRWLIAQDASGTGAPDEPELPMLQFKGFCAVCAESAVSFEVIGTLQRSFNSEVAGSWTLDYLFEPPLAGSVTRGDSIIKLTDSLDCL